MVEDNNSIEEKNKDALINSTDDLIWSVSKDYKLIAGNHAFFKEISTVLGVQVQTGVSLMIHETIPEDFLSYWMSLYNRALSGETFTEEILSPATVGYTNTWSEIRFNPIYNDDVIVGVACFSRNITERKIEKEKLKESELRFRSLIEHASDAIFILDNASRFIDINAAGVKMFGYSKDELISRPINELYSSQELETIRVELNQLKTGESVRNERQIKRKNGDYLDIETNSKLLDDGSTITFARDVTERNRIENANRFQAQLLNTIGQAVIATDSNGTINFWNTAAEKMFGWQSSEVIGKSVLDITPDHFKELSIEIIADLAAGKQWSGEFLAQRKDGSVFPVFATDVAVYDRENNITAVIGVSTDITERKKEEHILKVSEAKYRKAQMLGKMGNWELDLKSDMLSWSDEIYRIFGIDKTDEKVDFNTFIKYIHPDDVEEFLKANESARLGKTNLDIINRIIKKDGSICYVHELGELEYDNMGTPLYLAGTVQDITQQKKSEIKLREAFEQRLLFASIVHSSNDAIISKTLDGIITSWNYGAETIFGYSEEEAIGKSVNMIIPSDFLLEEREILHRINNGEHVQYFETERVTKNGMRINVSLTLSPIYNAAGNIIGVSKIARDITKQKKAEKSMQQMNIELHNLSKHLQDIREEERSHIAREIHDELGQQLSALKMNIEWFTANLKHKDDAIENKASDLLALIGETVQSVRRISSNLRPAILDDLGLIAAMEWQTSEAEKRSGIHIQLTCNVEDVILPTNIATGIFRIYQEALTNVVRHSNATTVTAKLMVSEHKIILKVTDDGDGLAPQTEGKKTFGILGMKERAFIMNGDLEIQSEPGKGTTITLTIPHQKHDN